MGATVARVWLAVASVLVGGCASQVLPTHHRFVVMSSQRSGTLFLVDSLNQFPCINAHSEMFLDRDDLEWTNGMVRRSVKHFAQGTTFDDPSEARPLRLTRKFSEMLNDTVKVEARGREEGFAVSVGFKWMVNQPNMRGGASATWEWFVDLCAKSGVKLVFLLRRSAVRMMVSRLMNRSDKRSSGHNAHPTAESKIAELRSQTIALRPEKVLAELASTRAKWDELERLRLYAMVRGVATVRLVYEDLDADHGLLKNLTDFLFEDFSPAERATCAGLKAKAARDRTRIPEVHEKIHTRSLVDMVSNWHEIRRIVAHSTFHNCLDDLPAAPAPVVAPPPPRDIRDSEPSLFASSSRPCWHLT